MKPDGRFIEQPMAFWANVRMIGQQTGYSTRETKQVKAPTLLDMKRAMAHLGLESAHVVRKNGHPTRLGEKLVSYFRYRASVLNKRVEPRLMDEKRAKRVFRTLQRDLRPDCPIPMNKQRGTKKAPAYFTGIVNMLIEAHANGVSCDYDPRTLTTVTRNGSPLRTLARRVDGAFPSTVNPVAVWEIKEYYYTTTFGSRVADGIYETLLDGLELEELRRSEGVNVKHYLMVDAHYTWWTCGRSYLCRIIDLLHMGYLDEALFGYEVVERLPQIVRSWAKLAREKQAQSNR